MPSMKRAACREIYLLTLFLTFSPTSFAASRITYPLGTSTSANSLFDVPSVSPRFSLTFGPGGMETGASDPGKGPAARTLPSSDGTAVEQIRPQSADVPVWSASGSTPERTPAQSDSATSRDAGSRQTPDAGLVGQVADNSAGSGVATAEGRTARLHPVDGLIHSRVIDAADPAEKNRASAGQGPSSGSANGASQAAGVVADAMSGPRSASTGVGKGTTDSIAPGPSPSPSTAPTAATAALGSQSNQAAASPMPAGAPATSSSTVPPSISSGTTAGMSTPQSGGSPPPANVSGLSGGASPGSNPPSAGSAAAPPLQPSSPSTSSTPPTPTPAPVSNANLNSVPVADNHLGAQFLIAVSPSLRNSLGDPGGTLVTASDPVFTIGFMSALSTSGTASGTVSSAALANSDLPVPLVEVAAQVLVEAAPATSGNSLVTGILPENIPEPRVLDMVGVLVIVLTLRHLSGCGFLGLRRPRAV
jgi:hypothetical protein